MVTFLLPIEAKNFNVFRKTEKSEFRAVIKHLYLKGLTPKKVKAELDEVHGTSAPVFATIYNWVNEFKRVRTSTKDEHSSGRPVEVTTPEMIDKIYEMVLSDRRIKAREIVGAIGIMQGTVFSILHEDGEFGRQGDGHGFSGCTRNHLHRLLKKRTNDNWSILCDVIAPVERKNQKKTSSFEKENILFHQDNARVHTCTVSIAEIMELKFELLQHPPY